MNRDKLYFYFAKYHAPLEQSTNDWYTATCPFCGKEKLAVNFNYNIVKCWRSCFNGFIVDFIQKYHLLSYFEAYEFIESLEEHTFRVPLRVANIQKRSNIILPKGTIPILFGDTVMGERARKYLISRKFDLNYLDRIGLGYCIENGNYFGYLIIPFKKRGVLSYFIGRDFINNFIRYKNPKKEEFGVGKSEVLFNEEALYLQDKIYLTEGWTDACTMGSQGISIQGSIFSTIQKNNILKSAVKEVVVIPDAGFYFKGLQMAKELYDYKKTKVLNLDNLCTKGEGKDVNEIGKETIIKLEDTTEWLNINSLYKELKQHA